jgi:hypothetical protein
MKPTIERSIETRFFKKHSKHMPALLNLTRRIDVEGEMAKDITAGEA